MLREERQLLKWLFQDGHITQEQMDTVINIQKQERQWLGVTLVVNGIITDPSITKLFATMYAEVVLAPMDRRRKERAIAQKLADAVVL